MVSQRPNLLLVALLLSGVSSVLNQVIWQRALRLYLAGNDAVSSMIVVFVYMLGMGIGAWLGGRVARHFAKPLQGLSAIEFALALLNWAVAMLLAMDLQVSVQAFQQMVLAWGVPAPLLYGVTATVVFTFPCLLMGMTLPVACEASQRQLGFSESRLLSQLFALNTIGAVGGAVAGSLWMLPVWGQRVSLLIAVCLNALAGVLLLLQSARRSSLVSETMPIRATGTTTTTSSIPASAILIAGFWLGFAALAFEMYLLRLAALAFFPRPYTFAAVLGGFLLAWSVGVHVGGKHGHGIAKWLLWLSVSLGLTLSAAWLARSGLPFDFGDAIPIWAYRTIFLFTFVPCFIFGVLYAQLIAANARVSWGNEVGQFSAWNTVGSCLGVLVATLIGFEWPTFYGIAGLALLCLLLAFWMHRGNGSQPLHTTWRRHWVSATALTSVALVAGFAREQWLSGVLLTTIYSRSGVVEITRDQHLFLDGLWHSKLSQEQDHIRSNNWLMAMTPLLCHAGSDQPLECCVVGMGTGITAATMAQMNSVGQVVTYEIHEGLRQVVRDFPDGTLHVATSPKIHIEWQDARLGLALSDRPYDIITQAPLYLSQSGSSNLLSVEYMQLIRNRLKPGGIFCLYANTGGHKNQADLVLRTAQTVFKHSLTFGDGYLIVVSDAPLEYGRDWIVERMKVDAALAAEVDLCGLDRLLAWQDLPHRVSAASFVVTDDQPLVEHPAVIDWLFRGRSASAKPTDGE